MATSLKNVLGKVRDAADDITSLDVVTLSGEVDLKGAMPADALSLPALYKQILKQAKVEANIQVVAFTHIDLDRDAVNFVKSTLSEAEAPMVQAHNEMVKTAEGARRAFVQMVKEVVGL